MSSRRNAELSNVRGNSGMSSRQHAEPYGQQASEDQVLLWQIVDTVHASLLYFPVRLVASLR